MMHQLPDTVLSDLSDLLGNKMGIHFPKERWKDLERGISTAACELGFKDAQSCIRSLLATSLARPQLEILAGHLTIGETYFFREPRSFEAIERYVFTKLIHKRSGNDQHLRIWSAGCATGEEPYSLAILLHRLIPDISDWNISILATDINPQFLRKAEQGVYSDWSFRGVPKWIKDKYFTVMANGRYQIQPHIKRLVTFSYLNLAEDTYPALINSTNAMDLILCRNVLMYFNTSSARQVIENLHRCLIDGGWLAVSSVEVSHILFAAFAPVNFQDMTIYRKTGTYIKSCDYEIDYSPQTVAEEIQTSETKPFIYSTESLQPLLEETILPVPDTTVPDTAKPETGHYEKAVGLFHQGHYVEAADKLMTLITEVAHDTRAMKLMARILANQGQLMEAARWCEKAISINKLDAACYYLLATIRQECGQLDDAVTALKQALYLDQDMVLAHFALGNLARSQGKTRETNRHFANTLALLEKYQSGDILPESEGMTAQRLKEIIETVNYGQEAA
jgi:chemotaxis protein methyltransferase CheR